MNKFLKLPRAAVENFLASWKSAVSKPAVNQPEIRASSSRASTRMPWHCQSQLLRGHHRPSPQAATSGVCLCWYIVCGPQKKVYSVRLSLRTVDRQCVAKYHQVRCGTTDKPREGLVSLQTDTIEVTKETAAMLRAKATAYCLSL